MPAFFVYDHTQYYPSASIVEADTPEQATEVAGLGTEGGMVFLVDDAVLKVDPDATAAGASPILDQLIDETAFERKFAS